jgi:LysM repeat protein
VALIGGAMVAALWAAGGALGGSDPLRAGGSVYRVRPGDTLWELARRQVGPEGDPRPLIADIRALNDLSSPALRPGQVLAVP